MPKWSGNERSFKVAITYDKHGRAKATIPAPLIQGFDRPDTVTFDLDSGRVTAKFERKKVSE